MIDLFGNENILQKRHPIFTMDEIIEQAINDFKLRGYIFSDLPLFECMQELNDLIIIDDNECTHSYLGYSIADTYHKHRHFASAINMSAPYDSFGIDKNIRKVLEYALKYERKLVHRKYSFFNMVNGTQQCSNFRPAFAKIIYNKYSPINGKVLDTSTGYGGRLIGFLASLSEEYVGIDPNTFTHRANEKIKIDLGKGKIINLFNVPAEEWDNSSYLNYFDLAFTSPPYFKKEIYTDQVNNSCNKYPDYNNWSTLFLKVMIKKTFESLKIGSKYLLNIQDVKIGGKTYPLIEDSIKYSNDVGFKYIDKTTFNLKSKGNNIVDGNSGETILIFEKL